MIVNGASRRSVGFWTKHLANDKKNDRAELKEIRGLAAENLRDALLEMQQDAKYTRLKNFFYSSNFSPAPGEELTEEQWQRAFEIFEKHRGIPEGTARIVYEHEKDGRTHRHVIYSRVNTETGRAWPDRFDARICHAASREISEELGLQRTISPFDKDREGPRPERAPESWEMFRGLRSGFDPRQVKAEVTKIYRESENAADFVAGLRQHGYQLVQGDRRDYCILDPAGEVHSLARRIDGVKAKDLREFMHGIQREDFPTVEQAKAEFRERMMDGHLADLETVRREIAWEVALAKSAVEKEKIEKRFVEPTPKEMRERRAAEEKWPTNPPGSERSETSPEYHFDDAARQTTRERPEPGMPESFRGTRARIWEAYRHSDNAQAFAAALGEHDISLAAVSKDEAARSHVNAEFAQAVGNFTPRYREGEIVAVTEKGYVYKLSERATGDQPR
ncbi:MAG: relaxase/mobilization nuclease domain-containing protein, partial [Acidobacteriaceae bacterium]